MKVFVAGATGALGAQLLPRLAAAGHEVTGMTRAPGKQDAIRRLGARPVVLLLARRLAEGLHQSELERALPPDRVRRLMVGPLSVGALHRFLRDRLQRSFPRQTLLRIHERSGGNPFFALELASVLPADVDPLQPLPVPETVEEVAGARIAALPAAVREALALAAAVGTASESLLKRAGVATDALDAAVAACWTDVPAAQRKLVTTHDALSYYAERYGLEVIGTVIPSLSTQGQPSAGELSELADTIRDEDVRIIFAESSVDAKVERAIADETGAAVGRALWADSLGPEGSDGATYLESIASNTRSMVEGVTGGEMSCRLPGG
jgi:hypothetical protein